MANQAADLPSSRSTSAGSSAPTIGKEAGALTSVSPRRAIGARQASKALDYDYPVPVVVRNTFIETRDERTFSFGEFFRERRLYSCPTGRTASFDGKDDLSSVDATASMTVSMRTLSEAESRILRIADNLPEAPTLGSIALPTVGSAGHLHGTCKPCAFIVKGCSNGVSCAFCHLCGPEALKQRRKARRLAYGRRASGKSGKQAMR
eukprot:CAMPEP_0117580268 /NCGR_PEP_ID=MMETSP0784-20121206/65102_1 /TAXON_ID=39447 /ORGANISM="" /LENGTH=205 /DNA_ID=CAMNT_0005380299 /DNA_START=99 /DNA_END=716 /DNA_ORIENTATION=-